MTAAGEDGRRLEAGGFRPLADETTSVLIVGIEELEVQAMLVGGVGPMLAGVDRCPDCDGLLGGWGSCRRVVRGRGQTVSSCPSRSLPGVRSHACPAAVVSVWPSA